MYMTRSWVKRQPYPTRNTFRLSRAAVEELSRVGIVEVAVVIDARGKVWVDERDLFICEVGRRRLCLVQQQPTPYHEKLLGD